MTRVTATLASLSPYIRRPPDVDSPASRLACTVYEQMQNQYRTTGPAATGDSKIEALALHVVRVLKRDVTRRHLKRQRAAAPLLSADKLAKFSCRKSRECVTVPTLVFSRAAVSRLPSSFDGPHPTCSDAVASKELHVLSILDPLPTFVLREVAASYCLSSG